jgi:hypothetical protein
MSPEALQGQMLTSKTDVYSFGMILWVRKRERERGKREG